MATNTAFSHRSPSIKEDPDAYDLAKDVLSSARSDFDTFLANRKPAQHFLNVSTSDYPRRRIDLSFTYAQRIRLEEQYKRNASTHRWETEDGRPLVEESEIFNTIMSYLRGSASDSLGQKATFSRIAADIAGIHRKDVKHAIRLWHHYRLGRFTEYEDGFWYIISVTRREYPKLGH